MKQEEIDLIKYGNCFVEHKNGEPRVICPEDVALSNGMYEVKVEKERTKIEKKRNFLECMFRNLDDIKDGTDEEVKQDLVDMGIDIDKAKASFDELIFKLSKKRTGDNV
jgi:hypothetical protein